MAFMTYLITAIALVLVIEGLLYACFPEAMKRMMAQALSVPDRTLRIIGGITALTGLLFAYLIQIF